jgi:hypothetical protein
VLGVRSVIGFHTTVSLFVFQENVPVIGGDEEIDDWVDAMAIDWSKVIVILVQTGIFVAPLAGYVSSTFGTLTVEKVNAYAFFMAFPDRSFAAVEISIMYIAPVCRFADGVHVWFTPLHDHAQINEGADENAASADAGFMLSFHRITIFDAIEVFVAPFAGVVETMYGG